MVVSVVVITGCSSGFGLEAAIAFAERGDTVVATMRNLGKDTELRKRAADAGVEIDVEALDVRDDASVAKAFAAIEARHGTVDVLVNNAGVGFGGPIETMPMDAALAVMDTNFFGTFRCTRAVLPGMRAKRGGAIVNVASISGILPGQLYTSLYSASKHAVNALSAALASEVEPFGIRVASICPGFFATEIGHNNDSVEDGIAASAYEADATWWNTFMQGSIDAGADPRIVADAIVAAATDEAPTLLQPLGDDAALYVSLLESVGYKYEAWMEVAIPVVEGVAGPRPEAV
jgi:NAD(P)-dependent dehydrogenase (short-subunit alcohol dehydrogenase family)